MGRAAFFLTLFTAWFATAIAAYSQIDEPVTAAVHTGYGVGPTVLATAEPVVAAGL